MWAATLIPYGTSNGYLCLLFLKNVVESLLPHAMYEDAKFKKDSMYC